MRIPRTPTTSDEREKLSVRERKILASTVPETPSELWDTVSALFNIQIPYQSCCPGHTSPFEAFWKAFTAEYRVNIWKASRGLGGKTHLLATLSLTEQVILGASISLLGGSLEQSERVHDYLSGRREASGRFWDSPNAPTSLLVSDPGKQKSYTRNGGYIKALAASSKSVRGPHPQRLRLDEIDEMDVDIVDDALGQPQSKEDDQGNIEIASNTVMSSTHQYPDGTMTEMLDRAMVKDDWSIEEWCDRETRRTIVPFGWCSDNQVEEKKSTMSAERFDVEVRGNEPKAENLAIQREAVAASFLESRGSYEGANGELIRLYPPGEGQYFHGGDWAKEKDWTVIVTLLKKKGWNHLEVAAFERCGRMGWSTMIGKLNQRVERYGGHTWHDKTGIGNVVHDFLEVPSEGHDFSNRKKTHEILTNYISGLEDGDIKWPLIDFAFREHKRAQTSQIYGSDHLPDTIAAASLAYWAYHEMSLIGLTTPRD